MVIQTAPFHNDADRLDNLSADVGIPSVVRSNPQWDGSAWIENAVVPPAALDIRYSPLRTRAAALKAQLDADAPPVYELPTTRPTDGGQIHESLERFATPAEAVAWTAATRALTPQGSVFGRPDLGSDLYELLAHNLSAETLGDAQRIVRDALARDAWYDSAIDAGALDNVIIAILARLRYLSPAEA